MPHTMAPVLGICPSGSLGLIRGTSMSLGTKYRIKLFLSFKKLAKKALLGGKLEKDLRSCRVVCGPKIEGR